MYKLMIGAGVILSLSAPPLAADEQEHREHEAHVHGIAHLNVALEGATVHIELESPAANIVGFEHKPNNEEQKQAVEQAVTALEDGAKVFTLTPAAGCEPTATEVEWVMTDEDGHEEHAESEEAHHSEAEETGHDGEKTHSEFHAAYRFTCAEPDQLSGLEVKLFELFPATEEIDAQIIGRQGQTAAELTAAAPRVEF